MTLPTFSTLREHAAHHAFFHEHLLFDENETPGAAHARFRNLRLHSAYQPIFDVSVHGITQALSSAPQDAERFGDELGFQALTQTAEGHAFDLFDTIADDHELVVLDRLARTLHAINFFGAQRRGLLFLRVHERLLKSVKYDHGKHFASILASFELNPARVVIELPSAAVAHRTFLGYLAKSYQRYGFKVSGNLPNAGHILAISELVRLDFVKIDGAATLRDAMAKPLIAYANRLHLPLIFDRIATATQLDTLQQFGARFAQGPLFESG